MINITYKKIKMYNNNYVHYSPTNIISIHNIIKIGDIYDNNMTIMSDYIFEVEDDCEPRVKRQKI